MRAHPWLFAALPLISLPLAALVPSLVAAPALARSLPDTSATFGAAIYVEHTATRDGSAVRSLEPARQVSHGERVVTLVNWSRPAGRVGFTLVNALPAGLNYLRSTQDNEEVSVDGGHSWGRLGALRIGDRLATPEDVTHLRWQVTPDQAAAGSGQIAYAGVVR